MDNRPIGVMDSGLGGISVLREIVKILPHEDIVFFGDSKNAPYGERGENEVRRLTSNAVKYLVDERNVKAVVLACNTATSCAAEFLRDKYSDMIIVGIEPALKPALQDAGPDDATLILATSATLKGQKLHDHLNGYDGPVDIYLLEAPGIVHLVEEKKENSDEMREYLKGILLPFRKTKRGVRIPIRSIVLGCTHFPFAKEAIAEVMGYPVDFYDGAGGTARQLKRRLEAEGLRNDQTESGRIILENSAGQELAEREKYLLEK